MSMLWGGIHLGSGVDKILVENDRAVGIRRADGTERRADIVISRADGRKTILNLLDGRYTNEAEEDGCKLSGPKIV